MSPELSRTRGALDIFTPHDDGTATLAGWIGHPDHPLDGATVTVDEVAVGSCALVRRPDLVEIWPHLPAMHVSGYSVRGRLPPGPGALRTIAVTGTQHGQAVAVYRTHREETPAARVLPDPDLLMRVSGNRDAAAFTQIGLDATMDLMSAVARHRGLARVAGLLDWGCGPGRISAPIARLYPQIELAGADLDAEAIAWCNQHLQAGAFHVTKPYPPLPFPGQTFDAVVAVSVMSHLDWPVQRQWLAEIRRLLKPGGIFAASIHGWYAAAFFPGIRERLQKHDFLADGRDKSLHRIAPRGYYRSTFQTPAFTREHWAQELEVVAYHEAGLAGFQDLVITRRPA